MCLFAASAALLPFAARITSEMSEPLLPFGDDVGAHAVGADLRGGPARTDAPVRSDDSGVDLPDGDARRHAVNPGENVVREASAGAGTTRVLVQRSVNPPLACI